MKIFVKVFPVLLFFSFLWISWIDFNDEKSMVNCEVDLGPDVQIYFWDSVQIHALINRPIFELEEIIWSPAENLSCSDCLDPFVSTGEDICISLTTKFDDGCMASDEICIFVTGCGENYSENKINSISPQSISDNAAIELEIAQTQFVHIEIVENNELINTIFEGWLRDGLHNLNLDFSDVPAGNYSLRVRLYPENKFVSITKL